MAFPRDDLDGYMPNAGIVGCRKLFVLAQNGTDLVDISCKDSECEELDKWKGIESYKGRSGRFTRNGVYLSNNFIVEKDNPELCRSFESEQDFITWCSETAYSFDRNTCEDVKLWLEGSPAALVCLHREGSFDLKTETLARCFEVANVIAVSCFLFCLRIGTFEDGNRSVIDKARLIDHLSALLDKWNCRGEKCRDTFNKWIDYVNNEEEKEEALKLLYQWTASPMESVLVLCDFEILGFPQHDYAKVERVSKWADEVCVFLENCRMLFKASDVVEFLYSAMHPYHYLIADLHLILGNRKRATELLETLEDMLEEIEENDLMVTELGPGAKIEYLRKDIHSFLTNVRFQLWALKESKNDVDGYTVTIPGSSFRICRLEDSRRLEIQEELKKQADMRLKSYDRQVETIIYLTEENRFSEAGEIFKQIDLNRPRRRRDLSRFLEYLNFPEIQFLLNPQVPSEILESYCKRQELLLDVSEILLDDRHLTAKFLLQYAKMIGIRSKRKYWQKISEAGDDNLGGELVSSQLYLWLKEEFNLQLTLPVPECIQAVIACLRDPCESGEHKRDNLSDTLKTYRLLKRSIDIFSELLHRWSTQETLSEGEWLQLLESQKKAHDSILCFIFEIVRMCGSIMNQLESVNSSGGADNGLKGLVGSNHSNLLVYQDLILALMTSAFMWVERGRARTLLTQLGPWYNMRHGGGNPAGSLKEELIKFDKDEQAALSSILSSTSACKAKTLFIEYAFHANEEYGTAPAAFMTNEQSKVIIGVTLSKTPCAADGRYPKQVEELLNKFHEMVEQFCNTKPLPRRLEDGVVGELHRVLEKLYDLLIEPFSDDAMFTDLDPKATIVFVPDKMLYRVPFALLRDKRTRKYLFQIHPIAISPSLRVLQHCERQLRELEKSPLKPDGCILAVGNAAYEKNPLPGTRKELEYLLSSFPGRVKTLQQEEATRANFLEVVQEASRSQEEHVFAFIHLGVHCHWSRTDSGDNDERLKKYKTGSLQFAKPSAHSKRSCKGPTTEHLGSRDVGTGQSQTAELGKELKFEARSSSVGEIRHASAFGEVGAVTRAPDAYRSSAAEDMLPSEDIINGGFQWRTRLVVLSACNSLRGQGFSDGEVNLPRALMIAGVPAAVVSQWKVSDVGSPKLMKAFYEHLQQGQDVATALQSAMIQLSNDPDSESANNVFEWGPFLVWGLPTVQLPKEMLTENARKALSAKRRAEMLRSKFNWAEPEDAKVLLLNSLKAVNNVLEAVYDEFALEDEAIVDAVFAVHKLLDLTLAIGLPIYEENIQLAEEFFTLLPFEQLEKIELELKNRTADCRVLYDFRNKIMYTQVMKGNYLIALGFARKLRTCKEHGNITSMSQICRLNEAVILRLMGKYEEALKIFDELVLSNGKHLYEILIQTSYLKYLMEDRSGALEYAVKAKKYEVSECSKLGYAFTLSYKALPNEYREWLLNVVDSTGASSSRIWDLLPVQHPLEPIIRTKNASLQLELLQCFIREVCEDDTFKLECLKALNVVENFFSSVDQACVLSEEGLVSAIIAMEHLLDFAHLPSISKLVIALGEEFYTVIPFELSTNMELQLEIRRPKSMTMVKFRFHRMYALAMKGSYQTALEYADKMIDDIQNADRCRYDESIIQYLKENEGLVMQERGVILRLMGKYDEALKQFEEALKPGEDYECLVQTSYLKHLMKDDKGALEYALRAKILKANCTGPNYGAFILGVNALPHEYRQWLVNLNRSEDDDVKLGAKILLCLEPLLKLAWDHEPIL